MKFDLLDQTILQAIAYFEGYLAKNHNVMSCFLSEIAIIAVELAIKNNEDRVLSLDECVNMVDNITPQANQHMAHNANTSMISTQSTIAMRQGQGGHQAMAAHYDSSNNTSGSLSSNRSNDKFTVPMFAALERHMLLMLNYRINIPTALDFALFFAHKVFAEADAQHLVQKCIPWFYYMSINYDLSRGVKPSAIALAALCHVIQGSESYHSIELRDQLFSTEAGGAGLSSNKDLMAQSEQLLKVFHLEVPLYRYPPLYG